MMLQTEQGRYKLSRIDKWAAIILLALLVMAFLI